MNQSNNCMTIPLYVGASDKRKLSQASSMCVRACMRACVRACVGGCVGAWVRGCVGGWVGGWGGLCGVGPVGALRYAGLLYVGSLDLGMLNHV